MVVGSAKLLWGGRALLKAYAIENLRPGMIIGRDVLDENANVLLGAGTALTKELIYNC